MARKPIKPVFLALALLALLNYLPLVAVAKDDPLHGGLKQNVPGLMKTKSGG